MRTYEPKPSQDAIFIGKSLDNSSDTRFEKTFKRGAINLKKQTLMR